MADVSKRLANLICHNLDLSPMLVTSSLTLSMVMQVICVIFPFTMARSFLTVLRSSKLGKVLPMNKNVDLHKELGYHFLFWSIIHTACHFINIARFAEPSRHRGLSVPVKSQREMYKEEVQV